MPFLNSNLVKPARSSGRRIELMGTAFRCLVVRFGGPSMEARAINPGRTDLDTFAWYTGRLVVGVFEDEMAGGPIDCIEVIGPRASLGGEAA